MTRTPRTLNRLAYYAAVVEAGSFTAAAKQLGITKAVVSEQVARLEAEAGVTLLVRTTRKVIPTDAGLAFHARCAGILRQFEDAFEELEHSTSTPKGHLRVTAPYAYGTAIVAPAAAEFTRLYPDCSVTLLLSEDALDLVSDQIDLAVRLGWLQDSSLQAKKLGAFDELLVCGQGYAAIAARLLDPRELEALPWVTKVSHKEPGYVSFQRRRDDERRDISVRSGIAIDAAPAMLQATISGGGFAVLPDFLVAEDLAAGRLLNVLRDWKLRTGGIHAVYPPTRFRPAKTIGFVEILVRMERTRQSRWAMRSPTDH